MARSRSRSRSPARRSSPRRTPRKLPTVVVAQTPSTLDASPSGRVVRRTLSVTGASDRKLRPRDGSATPKKPKKKHSTADVHHQRDSLFDQQKTSFRGFVILCLLVVLLANLRLIWQNVFKYGLLVDFRVLFVFVRNPWQWPCLSAYTAVVTTNILAALWVERMLARGTLSDQVGNVLHVANTLWALFFPVYVIRAFTPHPVQAMMLLLFTVVLSMKIMSFAHTNSLLREERDRGTQTSQDGLLYPDNLTVSNIYYFVLAPTLVYSMAYPRLPRFRKRLFIRWCIEFFVFSGLVIATCQQYILPLLENSVEGIKGGNYIVMIERLLKLSLPNLYVWIVGFYVIFHLLLNILGEVTGFADRLFYKDWWNAKNLEYFWRTWNMPVHNFMKCHVYIPLVSNGFSKLSANLVIFTLSAALHELIISVPFQSTKMYAFFGMMAQIPLIFASRLIPHADLGNVLFWLSILLGQPLIVLIYFYEYTAGI